MGHGRGSAAQHDGIGMHQFAMSAQACATLADTTCPAPSHPTRAAGHDEPDLPHTRRGSATTTGAMHGAAAPLAPQTGPSTTAAAVPLPLARNSSSSAALGAPRAQPRATTRLAKARAAVLGLLSCGSIAPATAPAPAPAGPDAAGNGGAGKPPLPPSDKGHGQQHPVVAACAVGHGGKQGSAAAGCIAAPLAAWFSGGSPRANRCRIAAAALLLVAVLVAAIVPAVVLKAGQKSSAQQEQPAPGQPGQGGVPPGGAGPSTPKRNVSQAFVHVNDDLQVRRGGGVRHGDGGGGGEGGVEGAPGMQDVDGRTCCVIQKRQHPPLLHVIPTPPHPTPPPRPPRIRTPRQAPGSPLSSLAPSARLSPSSSASAARSWLWVSTRTTCRRWPRFPQGCTPRWVGCAASCGATPRRYQPVAAFARHLLQVAFIVSRNCM